MSAESDQYVVADSMGWQTGGSWVTTMAVGMPLFFYSAGKILLIFRHIATIATKFSVHVMYLGFSCLTYCLVASIE